MSYTKGNKNIYSERESQIDSNVLNILYKYR
jgi:hypothetical protein